MPSIQVTASARESQGMFVVLKSVVRTCHLFTDEKYRIYANSSPLSRYAAFPVQNNSRRLDFFTATCAEKHFGYRWPIV